ncbi:OVARIAN TUMOR DOMAIN-containing deubiquitinating enzyme 6-like protein [Drosera capensis]
MTRIFVQRGSGSSSSNQSRTSVTGSSSAAPHVPVNSTTSTQSSSRDEDAGPVVQEQVAVVESVQHGMCFDDRIPNSDHVSTACLGLPLNENVIDEIADVERVSNDGQADLVRGLGGLLIGEGNVYDNQGWSVGSSQNDADSAQPPPPPVPPPKPSSANSVNTRRLPTTASSVRTGPSRRGVARPVPARTSPSGSRPSSPRSHCESEGYNSADEQNTCFVSSYEDMERERQFEIDIRRAKGFEVRRMLADGNCLFRAVADQVYGDSEAYDLTRQMCFDYMERERDHFSQFVTEGFTSYCKRKRRDKVYGNNVEIQALSEMYNRPIHIYSYSTEPINIFHGSYSTDSPPIRLSYHHGNHYNSLVDPRRLTIGAGLGFSSLHGRNVDKDQVKAAIKAQQDQQIDNASAWIALLAEGRFFSDVELTEKEIERMVMEASRTEYLAGNKFNLQLVQRDSSTSSAEPSSSGANVLFKMETKHCSLSSCTGPSGSNTQKYDAFSGSVLSSSVELLLSMGFSYMQAIEAYSIFGDDVDSMVCYLLETGSSSRRKGKATE